MHPVVRAASLFLLAACAAKAPSPVGFRTVDAPIWSAAALQPSALAGSWLQVAAFAPADAACAGGGVEINPQPEGLQIEGALCRGTGLQKVSGLAKPTGPGRFALAGAEWWVLWVDDGYRTLAIGTPSGSFGFVLDRGTIAPDRLQAAREILDFNGYRAGELRPF